MNEPVLSARNLTKSFAGRTVLKHVDLDVLPGEIHGLVGQNGSGKSTLVKILSGYYAPDPGGQLRVGGRGVALPIDPAAAHLYGLAFVHQDLALAGSMTVLENLRVGRYETRAGWRIPWHREHEQARRLFEGFGLRISPDAVVAGLREVERAMVAILRALEQINAQDQGVLVLDEPTAYLPRDGVDHLFRAVQHVTRRNIGVLLVTHRLEEIHAYTDRVTVLRNGERVAVERTSGLDDSRLIELIVGRSFEELYPPAHAVRQELVFSVSELVGPGLAAPFSLRMRRGEIVGLTGLAGMGYEKPLYLVTGARRPLGGTLTIGGREIDARTITPRRALDLGLALLPADRTYMGAVQSATVTENVTLPTVRQYFRTGLFRHGSEQRRVTELLHQFQVTPPQPRATFATLSGGNQQKALMAKWFATGPRVLLLHEPTQGVDVGARQQIFVDIRNLAESGTPIIIASIEYADLARLCDRVLVFRNGTVAVEMIREDLSEERLLEQSLISTRIGERGEAHVGRGGR